MPKSKRAKVVHLSKTEKKGKEFNHQLADKIRTAADQYDHIFVFSVSNMRNTYLKDVRAEFSDSRMFFGKTKVMALALGLTREAEHLPSLSKLTRHIAGTVGLLFTSRPPSSVLEYFASYTATDYARAGVKALYTFTVPAGTVYSRGGELPVEDDVPLPHSLEPTMRKWGMPTRLVKGKVTLEEDYTVCSEGKVLNSHQTALLKTFGVAMAEFRIRTRAYYSKETAEVTVVDEGPEDDAEGGVEVEDMDVDGEEVEIPDVAALEEVSKKKGTRKSKRSSVVAAAA